MTDKAVTKAIENVYTSLHANNEQLDERIAELKAAMAAAGEKVAIIEGKRLPQNNRQGRKMMQTYFKKRGVALEFKLEVAA